MVERTAERGVRHDRRGALARPVYKPHVAFDQDALIVRFDYHLRRQGEELAGRAEAGVSQMRISPGAKLSNYWEFYPKPLLAEVARGLKTYRDDSNLSRKDTNLLNCGIQQIEEVLKRPKESISW